jgi:hypothetical protein
MGEKRGRLQEIIKAIEELEQKLIQDQFFTAEEKFYDQVKDFEVRVSADNSFHGGNEEMFCLDSLRHQRRFATVLHGSGMGSNEVPQGEDEHHQQFGARNVVQHLQGQRYRLYRN